MSKTGFLEESEGVKSSTRLNSFILLFFLMFFDVLMTRLDGFTIDVNFISFNFLILLAIFAPKYLHKIAEKKFMNGK